MKSIFLVRNSLLLIFAACSIIHNPYTHSNPLVVAAAVSSSSSSSSSIVIPSLSRHSRTRIGTTNTVKVSQGNPNSSSLSRTNSESSIPLFDIRGGSAAGTSDSNNMSSEASVKSGGMPDYVKLLIGAGGIYGAFLYYGSLQEDVFRYTAVDGTQFKEAWFLQVLEALANVVVGSVGLMVSGATSGIPKKMFAISGATQVSAKAMTSLALANGLSFPVATLGKFFIWVLFVLFFFLVTIS